MLVDSKTQPFHFGLFANKHPKFVFGLSDKKGEKTSFAKKCECKEKLLATKAVRNDYQRNGRALVYPERKYRKTFEIKYNHKLSLKAKSIMSSFRYKYIYYAIDDLLDLLKSNPVEKENLLGVLYSSILSLHNNLEINFFDIWIDSIFISEIAENNRFLTAKEECKTLTHITLKLVYRTRLPFKKPEALW